MPPCSFREVGVTFPNSILKASKSIKICDIVVLSSTMPSAVLVAYHRFGDIIISQIIFHIILCICCHTSSCGTLSSLPIENLLLSPCRCDCRVQSIGRLMSIGTNFEELEISAHLFGELVKLHNPVGKLSSHTRMGKTQGLETMILVNAAASAALCHASRAPSSDTKLDVVVTGDLHRETRKNEETENSVIINSGPQVVVRCNFGHQVVIRCNFGHQVVVRHNFRPQVVVRQNSGPQVVVRCNSGHQVVFWRNFEPQVVVRRNSGHQVVVRKNSGPQNSVILGLLDSSRRAARFNYKHVMFGNRLVI
ncbi:hypothetical protein M5K25_019136 [Dendrobium thyrsiflorum]|uniref:Uncharacterized protein n=1 Tax=Dendrobium thyrsiflorum TaxID=117978 RepID=A0ABD0UE91_DENTH